MPKSQIQLDAAQEPVSVIHDTEDGQIHLLTLPGKEGGWKALNWGMQLAGGGHFRTMAQANTHLLRSFAKMFPNHVCTARCGTATEQAQRRAAAEMNFWPDNVK